ncbi:Hsp20/alpha crystallin family protein [Mucisphaera calidilacus]|uniref:Acid shock protein n=1 Tax=Mucisphaera calidilacus TaxID=2527982 RepID=A0A518BUI2_9BACT|nr:Hsp20 family protein [Mucisphaera calidilacus]QDU70652.1 Acid shock protein [Mucisphaera calidilacus]
MLTRTTRNPIDQLFREFDRALAGNVACTPSSTQGWYPVDVSEVDDAYVIEAELPGFTRDQISINLEDNVLTIEADRSTGSDQITPAEGEGEGQTEQAQAEKPVATVHMRERRIEQVRRQFRLPRGLDAGRIDASLTDGVLTVRLPKSEQVLPRQIAIN